MLSISMLYIVQYYEFYGITHTKHNRAILYEYDLLHEYVLKIKRSFICFYCAMFHKITTFAIQKKEIV